MKFIKRYGYGIYLGIALGAFADITYTDWQFYAILVPLVILVRWSAEH